MIHPTAIIETDDLGEQTHVYAYAHIMRGARLGCDVRIADHVFVETGATIGDRVTVKNNVCIWQGIHIEDDVFIGPAVQFTNDRYPRSPRMPLVQQRYSHPDHWLQQTHVRQGCSIGAAATICPGVILGAYSMIAAGSVVTHDVASFSLVAGSPARPVADVCRCGYRLPGSFTESVCNQCGEIPASRLPDKSPHGT